MTRPADLQISEAYRTGFLFVLIATFTPFKMVGYLLPALFLGWVGFHGGVSRDRTALLVIVLGFAAVGYELILDEFLVVNYAVAMVTYSAVLPVLLIESRHLASPRLLRALVVPTIVMVGFQGVVGLIQAAYGFTQTGTLSKANGDFVAGTIYPHLGAERAFSNPMFAVNMAMMVLACLSIPELATSRRRHLALGIAALVLASVLHVLLFLLGSAVIAYVLLRGRSASVAHRSNRSLATMLALVCALSYGALSSNLAGISPVIRAAFDLDAIEIPRAVLLSRVIYELPSEAPSQPYIGLGPGQFSSRASLIMSGRYLGGGTDRPKALPLLEPRTTKLADEYCISLMIAMWRIQTGALGSSQQPFFSWLSIYTELGGVGVGILVLLAARMFLGVRRRVRAHPERRLLGMLFCTGAMLMLMLGLQETYWEVPQAILVGVLLLKVLYANVMYTADDPS